MRQRSSVRHVVTLATMLTLVACGDRATGPTAATGPLRVAVARTELRLTNWGDDSIYTFVAERESLAAMNWAPCADPTYCAPLAPGDARSIRFTTDNRLAPGREAVVYWWYSVRTADGYAPDSIRSFVVRL